MEGPGAAQNATPEAAKGRGGCRTGPALFGDRGAAHGTEFRAITTGAGDLIEAQTGTTVRSPTPLAAEKQQDLCSICQAGRGGCAGRPARFAMATRVAAGPSDNLRYIGWGGGRASSGMLTRVVSRTKNQGRASSLRHAEMWSCVNFFWCPLRRRSVWC
jgi:hypothetical protein